MELNDELNNPLLQEGDIENLRDQSRYPSSQTFPKLTEEDTAHLDKAAEYDYCMVFPTHPQTGGLTREANRFLIKMTKFGLDMFVYYSVRKTFIFVMIRLSLEKLRVLADKLEFKMLLDENNLKSLAEAGDENHHIAKIDIAHDPFESELRPYQMIYCKYRDEIDEQVYWKLNQQPHPFRYFQFHHEFI